MYSLLLTTKLNFEILNPYFERGLFCVNFLGIWLSVKNKWWSVSMITSAPVMRGDMRPGPVLMGSRIPPSWQSCSLKTTSMEVVGWSKLLKKRKESQGIYFFNHPAKLFSFSPRRFYPDVLKFTAQTEFLSTCTLNKNFIQMFLLQDFPRQI